jgi:hypothetical protein
VEQPGDIRLTLRPLPSDGPVAARLKMLLKVALRRFDLRCVDVRAVSGREAPEGQPAGETDPAARPG